MANVFVIVGSSGSGKTTIASSLEKLGYWKECISHTTRPMRDGEVDGKTYYFTSEEEFNGMLSNGEFVEYVEYHSNRYGISKGELERLLNVNTDIFIIAENGGFRQIKEHYPDAISIFIHTSMDDCIKNMLSRGDTLDSAMKRMQTYYDELWHKSEYDYVIKNVDGKLDGTIDIVENIIKQYR